MAFVTGTATSFDWGSDTSADIFLSTPSGLVAGNVLIAIAYISSTASGLSVSAWTAPSGWTMLATKYNLSDQRGDVAILTRTVTGSEASSYNVHAAMTGSGDLLVSGVVLQYSGIDTTTPVDAYDFAGSASASTFTAPSVSPTGTTDAEIVAYFIEGSVSFSGSPSGFTQRATNTSRPKCIVYDTTLSSSGATATVAQNVSGATPGVAVAITLTPSASSSSSVTGVAAAESETGVAGTVTVVSSASVTGTTATETATGVAGTAAEVTPVAAPFTLDVVWSFDATAPGYVTSSTWTGDDDQAWAVGFEWTFIVDTDPPWDDTPLVDLTDSA